MEDTELLSNIQIQEDNKNINSYSINSNQSMDEELL